jgi:hypothetical protein
VIGIQRVPEPRSGKNRMHVDIHVEDLSAEARRLTALGATKVSPDVITEHDHQSLVMADRDGNEFCVVQRPEGVDDLGRRIERGESGATTSGTWQ